MRTAMRQMAGVVAQLERAMLAKRMRNGSAKGTRKAGEEPEGRRKRRAEAAGTG